MLHYFIFANLYGLLFFVLYKCFLAARNNFDGSRFYLRISIVLALVLPLLSFEVNTIVSSVAPMASGEIVLPEILLQSREGAFASYNSIVFYFLIAAILLFRLLQQYRKAFLFVKKQEIIIVEGCRVAIHTGIGPGCFGATIIFPGGLPDRSVLQHELAHIKFRHHIDKMALAVLECLFFPVLMIRFLKKELVLVHEFQADAYACQNKEHFIGLLLAEHFSVNHFSFTHTFFHHPLKSRIMMLQQSKKMSSGRKLLLGIAFGFSVSCIVLAQSLVPEKAYAQKSLPLKDSVYTRVEQMPEFTGGETGMIQYLTNNIHYPKGDSSTVTVRVKFVVSQTGKVVDAKVPRPNKSNFDQEALRVINEMPDWTPGKDASGKPVSVYFMIPIKFQYK